MNQGFAEFTFENQFFLPKWVKKLIKTLTN